VKLYGRKSPPHDAEIHEKISCAQPRQSHRHADPRQQWPQVAHPRIGVRNTGHGH